MSRLEFDEKTHTYTLDGEVVPSVTEILRFANFDVAVGANEFRRDIAANRGTRVHEVCAEIDYGAEPAVVNFDIAGYVQAYKNFLRDYRIKDWLAVEQQVHGKVATDVGRGLVYAGTVDRIGMIDGKLTVLDIKTGSRVNKKVLAGQLWAYSNAHGSTNEEDCELWGLHLKKDGKYSVIKADFYDGKFLFWLNVQLHYILGGKQ